MKGNVIPLKKAERFIIIGFRQTMFVAEEKHADF